MPVSPSRRPTGTLPSPLRSRWSLSKALQSNPARRHQKAKNAPVLAKITKKWALLGLFVIIADNLQISGLLLSGNSFERLSCESN
jgi:hypothetical protein